ncbi:DUF2480 family protein [Cyclobacterium amurskyense]|uniref:DUF2480 family protein n=1 Tax=Cyclobacterium amurskyense TaxID=320787 RepID=A0A0H4P9V9_9BACT|nr:DUF2480 family protein [Cyclobacterium amurskyense]AKP51271.1 hypothetical protein CA2015_1838 [Cyclobacterium amurskyense]|tara:strand:- start:421 stop:933 length:513 start_codon:yes stop_codon:yes gene_type:complete
MSEIINRVANSPIVTLDLESYYIVGERVVFDLEPFLFQGLVVKEKEYRESFKNFDWSIYSGKLVAITCSTDAIIPKWAYMLAIVKLQPVAKEVIIGSIEDLELHLFNTGLNTLDLETLRDRPVVIKGCGKLSIPDYAYGEIVKKVMPIAKSVMFGEPCSTVPVYKRPKAK